MSADHKQTSPTLRRLPAQNTTSLSLFENTKQHDTPAAQHRVGLGAGDALDVSPARPRGFITHPHGAEGLAQRDCLRRQRPLEVVVDASRDAPGETVERFIFCGARVAGPDDPEAAMKRQVWPLVV